MPRGIKKEVKVEEITPEIEVITPETPEVKEEGLYELKALPKSFSRCKCGKLLSADKMYNVCPSCGNKR